MTAPALVVGAVVLCDLVNCSARTVRLAWPTLAGVFFLTMTLGKTSGSRLAVVISSLLVLFSGASCSSSSNTDDGCSSDNDCKGDRVCTSGACVAPGEGTGGTDGNGQAGTGNTDSSRAGESPGSGEGAACTLSSEDCDPDCQASCDAPDCIELCCKTVESPGVTCDGRCQPEGTQLCDGACVDTTSDAKNCGSCGTVCEKPMFIGCRLSECEKPSL
jgi:hypothetical protein